MRFRWATLVLLSTTVLLSKGADVCDITAQGAVGDNRTLNTAAIQRTIDECPSGGMVLIPRGAFRTGSIKLKSHMRLHIAAGAGLYGSTDPHDYAISYQWFGGGHVYDFNALIFAANVTNVSITGENSGLGPASSLSIVDGVGWRWWCQAKCIPILNDGLDRLWCDTLNPDNSSLPVQLLPHPQGAGRPRLIDFYNSSDVTLQGFTAQNSAFWTVHLQYSTRLELRNLTVLSPRSVGNTDGIDPDSCQDVLIEDCYVDVGDDGISIKSDNITIGQGIGIAPTMIPTRNVTMRRVKIRSRNWCIGSSTFGGVYDILLEDSEIGDPADPDAAPVPWAIKFKSHQYFPGPIENVTVRRVQIGCVNATPWMYPWHPGSEYHAFDLGLTYGGKSPAEQSGIPHARNITFEDIRVVSADRPGIIAGLDESCFEHLTFRNVTFTAISGSQDWGCVNVQQSTFAADDVKPPISECGHQRNYTCLGQNGNRNRYNDNINHRTSG